MKQSQKYIWQGIAAGALMLPTAALADGQGLSGLTITGLATDIVNIVWIIFTAVAVICFIIAGIQFMTAFGDPEKIKTARAAFIWGVVGVVVAVIAFSAVRIITAALGG